MAADSSTVPPINQNVASILDAATAPIPSAPGRPVKTSGLSMTPEAIRMRARRAKAKQSVGTPTASAAEGIPRVEPAPSARSADAGSPAAPPAGEKLTPGHLQLMPDGPSRPVVTPERYEKAVRDWTKVFQGAGLVAAKILFKSDALKVDEKDARDCAEALLDGWPELIEESSATFRQLMAVTVIGSVGAQRWDAYKAEKSGRPAGPAPKPVVVRDDPTSVLPMMPVSM